MMGIIFSFFSGIYQSLYDSVLGNVLNLLLRFPKSKVHFASVFTALLRPRVWERYYILQKVLRRLYWKSAAGRDKGMN